MWLRSRSLPFLLVRRAVDQLFVPVYLYSTNSLPAFTAKYCTLTPVGTEKVPPVLPVAV